MKFRKFDLEHFKRCYTVSSVEIDGKPSFIFSSDGKNAKGIACYGTDFEEREVIWSNSGGCMSVKSIPDKKNELLVILEFYLGDSPSFSKIVWFKKVNGKWKAKDLYHMPFIHRMDVITVKGKNIVVFATISHFKQNKEDWHLPGAIYACELPYEFGDDFYITPKTIYSGLFKNHGYYNDGGVLYFSGQQGVLKVDTAKSDMNTWRIEKVYEHPTSDVILADLNQDGVKELVVIDEFHGNQLRIVKRQKNQYVKVYQYSDGAEVIHGLSVTNVKDVPTLVVGVRKGSAELFAVQYKKGKFVKTTIDSGLGPINIASTIIDGKTIIAAANHTANLATIYREE